MPLYQMKCLISKSACFIHVFMAVLKNPTLSPFTNQSELKGFSDEKQIRIPLSPRKNSPNLTEPQMPTSTQNVINLTELTQSLTDFTGSQTLTQHFGWLHYLLPETFHTCALNQEEKLGKENVSSKVKKKARQLTIPAEDSKGGSRPARGLGGEDKRWGPVGTICLTRRAFWGLG